MQLLHNKHFKLVITLTTFTLFFLYFKLKKFSHRFFVYISVGARHCSFVNGAEILMFFDQRMFFHLKDDNIFI